jgi:hypothetical protein
MPANSAAVGQGLVWIDCARPAPAKRQDQTSSVTKGSAGANRRRNTRSASCRVASADSRSGEGASAYARTFTISR